MDLHVELDLITTTNAERLLSHSRSSYYEYGEKANRLLAHQLRRRAASRLIPQIKDHSGKLISDPDGINETFKSFYSVLYSSEFPYDTSAMTSFLHDLVVPTVDPAVINTLDTPLGIEEIIQAIQTMQNNKAPGPDGFPTEFFKKFQDKLAPLLLSVYEESLERGSLPETMTQASIILLLKKDKDPTSCSSYRPLSLQNVDAKILAKALATRLEKLLPYLISEEQTGFIKEGQLFF